MKRVCYIASVFLLIAMTTNHAFAHVFPTSFPQYRQFKYKIPQYEYYYIRIIPSPVLEGFASYEFCPLMQDKNKDNELIKSERQKLGAGDYHHNLINPRCQRPYQLNPLSPPVYFDLRDLDRILSEDENEMKAKLALEFTAGIVAMYFTAGALSPALVGWFTSASASMVSSYAATVATTEIIDAVSPTNWDRLSLTQVKYFQGVQSQFGSDMYWPVLPAEIPTFWECKQSCNQERYKREQAAKLEKEKNKSIYYYNDKDFIRPSETTNSMNPFNGKDECEIQCSMYPAKRASIKTIWNDLYLDTIYRTGHESYRDQYPKHNDTGSLEADELYERYHTQKHLDWSAWTIAVEESGKMIPNHYIHKGSMHSSIIWGGHNTYFLCDYLRTNAYGAYKAQGGKLPVSQWMGSPNCIFNKNTQCAEYFDSPAKSGNEICSVLTD